MATVTTGEPASAVETRPRRFRLTVDLYDRMVESGVFGDRSPVFLWKGELVLPMTKGCRHENALAALNTILVRLLPDGWHVRPGSPVTVLEDSKPEPDLSVVRGSVCDYQTHHPLPAEIGLAVEVADSSLPFDAGEKLAGYAAAGLAVYWVVNIPRRQVDVYSGPSGPVDGPSYAEYQSFGPGEAVPVILDGVEVGRVAARDVLP
jgi:Uma2 family endonuclease